MNMTRARIGPGDADVLLLLKSGLEERVEAVLRGEAPREFFYSFFGLLENGIDTRIMNTSEPYTGVAAQAIHVGERIFSRISGISIRRQYLAGLRPQWARAKVLASFMDHFSLTMGNYFCGRRDRPFTIGFFHGFSDIPHHISPLGRCILNRYVRRALEGLDVVGFFGPADRAEAVRRWDLPEAKTALVRFGVDQSFWTPAAAERGNDGRDFKVLSIGSDPNRDYDTLVSARLPCPVTIITRLPVKRTPDAANVEVTEGSFWKSPLTDAVLRGLYRDAGVVVVPLHDVFQPSGYSVTLQAMACGRPVVLSRNKGLWTPEYLKDGENCLLIPPGDPAALRAAVESLRDDRALAARIGTAGRKTVDDHFTIEAMNRSMVPLVQRGLAARAEARR
ncbi:glycosyltransferase family 4 protein [Shumkonia mesophila]|uniref:glycosyltransferase family 4 protein n=1 Tax=Shumkonia mesophila TaxID=2838854 RepID=UPI00293502E7|nr:glycosyltransferase family 4 protein [Shumkonia mesophila]